ncbi:hypothetical protein MKL09_08855 [Methylobacterium sp. J-048]|uniref:hypothetical protein n=1 Tax=Methylobacterium sp. J-048 TaxID=2836635 RepID=UPI001FB8D355|nr:hypothetical protein [Methylobacterium sp. J-048]MCJ2056663.1 hypothetical protein [Methylobacterium sp. J-048]
MQIDAAISGLRYLPRDMPGSTALMYQGFDDAVPVADDEVCERWGGPSQEIIFHIHKRDEPRWETLPGGDFLRRNTKDQGRVYFFLTSPEEYWSLTTIKSIIDHFPLAHRRCLTLLEGLARSVPILWRDDPSISEHDARDVAWLLEHGLEPRRIRMAFNTAFADRFLAKLAIGLGHTILGPRVSSSAYADRLRNLLWNSTPGQHADSELRGTGFWRSEGQSDFRDPLAIEGAWTIAVGAFYPAFGYSLSTSSGRSMSMMVSDDPGLWTPGVVEQYHEMQIFIVVPQRQLFLGPYRVIDFVSHRLGRRLIAALAELEDSRVGLQDLPPRRLPGQSEARGSF